MKQIDVFVDSIYQNVSGDQGEIKELKKEMKTHLLETVFELKASGINEEEAIKIAIERFGEENEMRSEVGQIFKSQRVYAKWILNVAIAVLVLAVSIFGYFFQKTSGDSYQRSVISTQIESILKDKTEITREMKAQIHILVDSTKYIKDVKLYNVSGINNNNTDDYFRYIKNAKPNFQYSRNIWAPKSLYNIHPSGGGDDQWYVQVDSKYLSGYLFLYLLGGIVIYWILFAIWAIINASHRKKINIGWILIFFIFNVLGYWVFVMKAEKSPKRLIFN